MATAGGAVTGPATLRRRIYEVLEPGSGDRLALGVDVALIVLVLTNVVAAVLESVPAIEHSFGGAFSLIEVGSVVVFSLEYALRLWSAPEHGPWQYLPPWGARMRFVRQPQAVIDLFSIAPFYLALFSPWDLRALLILRLLRFFKLARYSPGVASLFQAFARERRALMACGIILLGTVLIAASAMYYAEREAQPDKLGTIPDAMYWAFITLTTVGYGDVTPVTPLGKMVAALSGVAGIIMLALPVGILASAFAEDIRRRDFVVTWTMVARMPLFADLEAHDLGEIMRFLHAQSCESGETIVRRGDAAHSMYFISSGTVEVELPDRPVHLGAGDFFGEMALLRRSERSASVSAVTAVKLLVLDGGDLTYLMDQSPRMAERIREIAEKRAQEDGQPPPPKPAPNLGAETASVPDQDARPQ